MPGPAERLAAVREFRPVAPVAPVASVASVASGVPVVPDRDVGAGMIVGHE
jgi:hypothetical protein